MCGLKFSLPIAGDGSHACQNIQLSEHLLLDEFAKKSINRKRRFEMSFFPVTLRNLDERLGSPIGVQLWSGRDITRTIEEKFSFPMFFKFLESLVPPILINAVQRLRSCCPDKLFDGDVALFKMKLRKSMCKASMVVENQQNGCSIILALM
jgi:hypothetical protein